METEINKSDIALHEVLVAYIKIFLIQVLRMKQADTKVEVQRSDAKEPQIIQQLVDTIEREFKRLHSPAEYAEVLNISPNALAKIVKKYYNKTLTEIIAQRIMIEAKRELYLTGKTVKEIAYILGYEDEFYFSRFFKKHAQISPQLYRETVGFDKLRVLGLI
jgi:AraC-like DNA-binding protein